MVHTRIRYLPESLLREDDVSYENMKASVEKCFRLPSFKRDGYVVHRFLFLLDSNDILQDVKKNLRSIIKIAGDLVLYEKTRSKMRKIILEYLKKILQNPKHRNRKRFIKELPKLLKNPSNFHVSNHVQVVDPAYLSHHSAAKKILEGLEEMNNQLLSAMFRRLKGEVKEPKFGDKLERKYKNKPYLISHVRNAFNEELCKVRAGEELPIGLAKAMSVAVLGLRMKLEDNPKILFPEFCGSKSVIHGDLLKCIRILSDTKLKVLVDNIIEELRRRGNHSDESVGECEVDGSVLLESTSGENAFTLENVGQNSSDEAGREQKHVNKYLTIQETCDERSLGAHNLIGVLLEKLLDEEGAELDESKRLYLRGGRSDHQEDCAGSLLKRKKKKNRRLCRYQKMRASDKRKEVNALRRAPYKKTC